MVHALGLEIPSARLIDRYRRMQALGHNANTAQNGVNATGYDGFNVNHLRGYGGYGMGAGLDAGSDSDTVSDVSESTHSEASTVSGGASEHSEGLHSSSSANSLVEGHQSPERSESLPNSDVKDLGEEAEPRSPSSQPAKV